MPADSECGQENFFLFVIFGRNSAGVAIRCAAQPQHRLDHSPLLALMSSDEDQVGGLSIPAKKRRVQRACDMCRRKKSPYLPIHPSAKANCTFRSVYFAFSTFANDLIAELRICRRWLAHVGEEMYELH